MEWRLFGFRVMNWSVRRKRALALSLMAALLIVYHRRVLVDTSPWIEPPPPPPLPHLHPHPPHHALSPTPTAVAFPPRRVEGAIENNALRCRDLSLPKPGDLLWSQERWQTEKSKSGEAAFLYSAVFDDRPLAGGLFVRVNLLATVERGVKFFCHLWYEGSPGEPLVLLGALAETGLVPIADGQKWYSEYLLSCQLPFARPVPTYVSITRGEACKTPTTLMQVLVSGSSSPPPPPPLEFGVCVVNGHGAFTPQEIVEWFEFYKVMGIKEFNLYNTSYRGIDRVLEYYVAEGILRLDQIPHPLGTSDGEFSIDRIRNLRSTCLNDCMMRNMHRYRYLVVVDHDEFIVPRGNITEYAELIRRTLTFLGASEGDDDEVMSIGFRNAYFFRTFPQDESKPKSMKTLRFRFRTNPMEPYIGSKSILRPDFCFNLMNHYCYVRLPLYNGTVSHFAPPELALSHHYRSCGNFVGTPSCEELLAQKTADDLMLRFEGGLTASVERILLELDYQF